MSADAVRQAFDELAPIYDQDFTASIIGRLQREAVWRALNGLFPPGEALLDLGCGTGEDAVRLAREGHRVFGVDVSPGMIGRAQERAEAEGLSERLTFEALPLERLHEAPLEEYAGAYSNFGAVNCVADLEPLAAALADRIRPGGGVALVLMNRFCLWETLFYPLTLNLHKAFRRFSSEYAEASVGGEDVFRVYYPSVREVAAAFAPEFRLERAPGIGVFVPPSYLEPLARKAPRFVRSLAEADRALADKPLFRAIGDHRIIVLRRC